MKEEKFKYDFKYLQKQFENEEQTSSMNYISFEDLSTRLRDPQNQGSAERLLNLWFDHKFSFEIARAKLKDSGELKEGCHLAFELLRRVARAIPITKEEGGPNHSSSFKYQFRDREDRRSTDRRI